MNARRLAYSFAFALLAAPAAALACADAGAPDGASNNGGAPLIGCTDHAQCPEGQYCTAQGVCGSGSRDAGVCDDSGCHDCYPRSLMGGSCSFTIRYWCPDPSVTDAAVDAGGGGGGGGGCTVRAPGERAANSPVTVLAALIGVAALARVRRR